MRVIAASLLALVLVAAIGVAVVRRPVLPPAERGRRLAEHTGCFGCHGPGGVQGASNPGRTDKTVPNFEDDVMMFAKTPDEVHEWIHFGYTKKRLASLAWRTQRARGALKMPAFKGRMSERGMDDAVAYVTAMAGMIEPEDSLARTGLRRAKDLGCVGCHGPGGRLARPNPGSWKGCVPSWDGADFPEVVRDSTEFHEWVARGTSRRFEENSFARYFLRRAVLKMPGFQRFLTPQDVPALWAYVQWLRTKGSGAMTGPMEGDREP